MEHSGSMLTEIAPFFRQVRFFISIPKVHQLIAKRQVPWYPFFNGEEKSYDGFRNGEEGRQEPHGGAHPRAAQGTRSQGGIGKGGKERFKMSGPLNPFVVMEKARAAERERCARIIENEARLIGLRSGSNVYSEWMAQLAAKVRGNEG